MVLWFKETQSHLLQCPELVSSLKYLDVKPSNLIYGNTNQQEMIVKIFSDILDARDMLREKQNERE